MGTKRHRFWDDSTGQPCCCVTTPPIKYYLSSNPVVGSPTESEGTDSPEIDAFAENLCIGALREIDAKLAGATAQGTRTEYSEVLGTVRVQKCGSVRFLGLIYRKTANHTGAKKSEFSETLH